MPPRNLYVLCHLPVHGVGIELGPQILGKAYYGVEGGPQLVGHVGYEHGFRPRSSFRPLPEVALGFEHVQLLYLKGKHLRNGAEEVLELGGGVLRSEGEVSDDLLPDLPLREDTRPDLVAPSLRGGRSVDAHLHSEKLPQLPNRDPQEMLLVLLLEDKGEHLHQLSEEPDSLEVFLPYPVQNLLNFVQHPVEGGGQHSYLILSPDGNPPAVVPRFHYVPCGFRDLGYGGERSARDEEGDEDYGEGARES